MTDETGGTPMGDDTGTERLERMLADETGTQAIPQGRPWAAAGAPPFMARWHRPAAGLLAGLASGLLLAWPDRLVLLPALLLAAGALISWHAPRLLGDMGVEERIERVWGVDVLAATPLPDGMLSVVWHDGRGVRYGRAACARGRLWLLDETGAPIMPEASHGVA